MRIYVPDFRFMHDSRFNALNYEIKFRILELVHKEVLF